MRNEKECEMLGQVHISKRPLIEEIYGAGALTDLSTKNKKSKETTFEVPHKNMIDLNEVKSSVSRKNPLLFLELNDRIVTYIHQSIRWKEQTLNIENTLPHSFLKNEAHFKKAWIKHVKRVKKAKWGDKKETVKVKMTYPKI